LPLVVAGKLVAMIVVATKNGAHGQHASFDVAVRAALYVEEDQAVQPHAGVNNTNNTRR